MVLWRRPDAFGTKGAFVVTDVTNTLATIPWSIYWVDHPAQTASKVACKGIARLADHINLLE